MKKIFTFIAAALLSVAVQAQTIVGNEDNTSGWWTAFSPYYSIPANGTLSLNFVNYSCQTNNWNNWLIVLTNNTERGSEGYAEYCVLRCDNWAWNSQTNSGDNQDWFVSLASNYNWDTFKADMDGSTVAMTVKREGAKTTIHADITTTSGGSYYEDFVINCGDGTQPMGAFLSTELGHLVINNATVTTQSGAGESYKPIIVAEDGTISLAPEFAAVVGEDGKTATNVADGKSIVMVQTDNVTVEAVGGTTPANVEGGAQDITPGELIDEASHTYAVQSVGSWNNVEWKNGNNKTDINDAAGTKLYFLMGTGNPYVGLNAEEIYTDDSPTGTYRAKYDFYEPDGSKGMPLTGLYYKFTAKQEGDFKVQIWANKGNRQTFVVDESTQTPVPYTVEGYVNGQKANDESKPVYNEDGTPKLDNDGNQVYEQYCIFFTNEELQERHAQSGNADNPYIIDMGNQAFWGWLTFHAEANKSYWLFQHSSQVGFGGFEFTAGGSQPSDNELVINGDCEGDDPTSLVCKNGEDGGQFTFNVQEGVGVNNSRAVVVHSVSNAVDEWDSQFFIYEPSHVFALGEKYKVTFSVRADKEAQADLQAHSTPGNYIGWYLDGFSGPLQITTEWQVVTIEGTVSDAMAQYGGIMEGMQTIAFNLNKDKTLENNYYFDNISWQLVTDETAVEQVSADKPRTGIRYNLAGQKVDASYKGIVIQDGKKFIVK